MIQWIWNECWHYPRYGCLPNDSICKGMMMMMMIHEDPPLTCRLNIILFYYHHYHRCIIIIPKVDIYILKKYFFKQHSWKKWNILMLFVLLLLYENCQVFFFNFLWKKSELKSYWIESSHQVLFSFYTIHSKIIKDKYMAFSMAWFFSFIHSFKQTYFFPIYKKYESPF